MSGGDACAWIASALTGKPCAVADSPAQRQEETRAVIQHLRQAEWLPGADRIACALELGLAGKRDAVADAIGAKVGRGRAHAVPETARRKVLRDELLRQLANDLPGKPTQRAALLAAMAQSGEPRTLVIREACGGLALPTSREQMARIIRERLEG